MIDLFYWDYITRYDIVGASIEPLREHGYCVRSNGGNTFVWLKSNALFAYYCWLLTKSSKANIRNKKGQIDFKRFRFFFCKGASVEIDGKVFENKEIDRKIICLFDEIREPRGATELKNILLKTLQQFS